MDKASSAVEGNIKVSSAMKEMKGKVSRVKVSRAMSRCVWM